MRVTYTVAALLMAGLIGGPAAAQTKSKAKDPGPLVLKSQGSFFVGGETKTITQPGFGGGPATTGDITVNQMYVQYQIPPAGDRHVPVVMVHGCCLSSKTWETTPDGRIGWSEYFVRKNHSVYLADQVSRARSGFDATTFAEVKAGRVPPAQLPNIINATHQVAWNVFRFGPTFGTPFPDEQFPIEALDEFSKQAGWNLVEPHDGPRLVERPRAADHLFHQAGLRAGKDVADVPLMLNGGAHRVLDRPAIEAGDRLKLVECHDDLPPQRLGEPRRQREHFLREARDVAVGPRIGEADAHRRRPASCRVDPRVGRHVDAGG